MKNIETILQEAGIEADKVSGIVSEVNKNYRTVSDYEKQTKKLESAEQRATTAEDTLKGFEGKDFDQITRERDDWKTKYETMIAEETAAKEQKELNDAIEAAIVEAKGKNVKSIIAQLDMEAIKASKNRDKDIAAALKELSEGKDTAFLFGTDPEDRRAKFTGKMGKETNTDITSKADIYAKDDKGRYKLSASERQKAIVDHPEFFE